MCLQECWLHSLNLFAELQGSSADGVMRIYKDGCLIGENPGAMFGLATYFAEDFSKADLYAGPHCFKRCKGHCHVLVVAVLMGRGFPTTIPDRNATTLHLRSKREDTSHKDGVSRQSREIICSAINPDSSKIYIL
jgi:hypothetical protein